MKKLIITIVLFFITCFIAMLEGIIYKGKAGAASLSAQNGLDSMTIVSVGEYKPTIMDAGKINDNPSFSDSTKKIPVSAYSINSKKLYTGFNVEPIQPAQTVGEPLTKLYNALVKLGMGTYSTPYGELWFNSLRSKTSSYGLRYKHLSSSATLKDYGYAGFSDNEVSLYGKKFLKEHSLTGNFDYTRNVVHFYGYDATLYDIDRDSTRQRFNLFSGNAALISHYNDVKRINHDVKLYYYNLADKYGASENNIKSTGVVQTAIGKEMLKVNALVDFYNYKTRLDTINNTVVSVNPNFIATGEKYRINLGFTAAMDMFVKSKFYFYPNVDLSYNVIDEIIVPYVGLTGGIQKNSYKSFTDKNPFVLSELDMQNTNKKYDFYGGIRGTLSATTAYNARASYSNVNNIALFVNDTSELLHNKFTVIYDDGTLLNIHGEVAYQQREKLRISLGGDYYQYKMKTELRAWYVPQVQITASANYNLRDKIVIKADLFYIDNQFAKTFVQDTTSSSGLKVVAKELKGIFDANIGAEYRYTKKLGFFVNFNNIANFRYYRWSNYPTQRFNFMAGLSYSF
ncbi:MAG: hypothetical protein WAQ28_14930 [Bacteroidia bacterium]